MKNTFHNNQIVSVSDFTKMLKQDGKVEFTNWEHDINDLLYALETHSHVHLDIFNGKIKNIKIML